MFKRLAQLVAILLVAGATLLVGMGRGWFGKKLGAGTIAHSARPASVVAGVAATQQAARQAVKATSGKQILFGDLHVHTTFSFDAFMLSLPLQNGEGAHPPADACDFARYCSALDFWAITDHVEGQTAAQWQETKDTIRQCNASAGDPSNPDLVSFLGWEWTQMGSTPQNHYGHKNVIFLDTDDDKVPKRPIGATGVPGTLGAGAEGGLPLRQRIMLTLFAPKGNRQAYLDAARFMQERISQEPCPQDVDVHQLPLTCYESAATPAELFHKLDQWGFPALVIPHGTAWGLYTPLGATMDNQLAGNNHDPARQKLIEVYSGHGNSEEYRDWKPVIYDGKGNPHCPSPGGNYEPACWRAGEIIRNRCLKAGESASECESRAAQARQNFVDAGASGFLTVPGATIDEWGDAGQCRDCWLPAFNFRPGSTVQYGLAITNFDDPRHPKRLELGLIASSDNHKARPGTGYKQVNRHAMTEASGVPFAGLPPDRREPKPYSMPLDLKTTELNGFQLAETERQASFFLTGGLVAVHSAGRDRKSIWDALQRREVYGTSGEKILLWFDMTNAPGNATRPMGSEVTMKNPPHFVVRALGAFKQKPGCPDYAVNALGPEKLERICRGECDNPSDERKQITRIDVIRILPQKSPGEPVAPLIKDPWRTFQCTPGPNGCVIEFDDPEFPTLARDATYYVRAIEEPSPAIDGALLRCEYDAKGECVKLHPCIGTDDCLADVSERAWSSPIFVTYGGN